MLRTLSCLLFPTVFIAVLSQPFNPLDRTVLKLSYGTIKGKIINTSEGNIGYAYLRLPFAHPPIGPLRFRAPKPITQNDTKVVQCMTHLHK
jgi:hypothetical protein